MISDERLKDLIIWVDSKDGDGREYPDDAVAALQELLDARQKIASLQMQLDIQIELTGDVMAENRKNAEAVDKLIANSERLAERLKEFVEAVGFTGAIDGAMALSITSKGLRGIEDNLNSHADLMRKIKVQDAIDKTISENTEAWKKLADE